MFLKYIKYDVNFDMKLYIHDDYIYTSPINAIK
jgi:hypothetical protein